MDKEIIRDLENISKELKEDEEEIKKRLNPLWYIVVLFLILILIMWLFPYYGVKLDPVPKSVPGIEDVVPNNIDIELNNVIVDNKNDFLGLINPKDSVVKRTADMIISKSGCLSSKICHAKAVFYFVRDNFNYVSDPTSFEYVKTAKESLVVRGGDCDDAAVLLANLLQAIGVRTRFVFVPGHVYVQAYLPEALNRYREGEWVNLDATCKNCDFGQVVFKYKDTEKEFVG